MSGIFHHLNKGQENLRKKTILDQCLLLLVCTHSAHRTRHCFTATCTRVGIDIINYATKSVNTIKATFFYSDCDQM